MRVPARFVKKNELRKLRPGRRYVKGKSYVRREGSSLHVSSIKRSLEHDRRRRTGTGTIPRTRTGKPKSGYGHRGDYPRKRNR